MGRARTMTVVRPFRSRIVREERAADVVTPMFESAEATIPDPGQRSVDVGAYDELSTAVYVYRQRRGQDSHVGVVCDVQAEAFVNGQVRGHESIQPDRVEALVHHFATSPDRAELVALLHRAGPVFVRTIAETCSTPPTLRFTDHDGLEQTVWRVPEGSPTVALSQELSNAGHYIADGHHRVAARLALWQLAGKPPEAGLLCVVYPMDGLHVSAFHRRVTGPVDSARLLALLATEFEVRAVAGPAAAPGCLGVYVGRHWFDATFEGVRREGSGGLDIAILHDQVLEPGFGTWADSTSSVEIAAARTSLAELTQRCDEDGGALFTLAPPPIGVLTGLADRGEVMPAKTTYFEPKPYAGIFLRPAGR
jgi:uncharacterized protein (DUF1015 family)